METIKEISELRENLTIFEAYRYSGDAKEKKSQKDLVEKGIVFVAHKSCGRYVFAPSRFIGYKKNTLIKHASYNNKDGRDTTPAIDEILSLNATSDSMLEKEYLNYCTEIGVEPKEKGNFGKERRFWHLK